MNMLVVLPIAVMAGILPMLVYAGLVWWLDRWEKEPLPLLAAAFLWGFIPSAIFALITQLIIGVPLQVVARITPFAADLFMVSVVAPVTEEIVKGLAVLIIFLLWRHEFDSLLDGIVYGSMVGFGFAAIENILYFVGYADSLMCLIPMRAFIFGLNHALYTSFIGLGFVAARFTQNRLPKMGYPILGLGLAIFTHGVHNLLVSFGLLGLPIALIADWMGIAILLVIILISLQHENRWIRTYLKEEVALGTLTQAQLNTTATFIGRGQWAELLRSGPAGFVKARQFYHDCTELAFKKHQIDRLGRKPTLVTRVEQLRQKVAESSPNLT